MKSEPARIVGESPAAAALNFQIEGSLIAYRVLIEGCSGFCLDGRKKTTGLARASCSTKEHIRAIYGSVLIEEASNLHAGPCQAEMAETEVAQNALCSAAPPGQANSRQRIDAHRPSSKQIPEELD